MSLTTPTRGKGFSRLRTDSTVSLPVIILFRLISAAINAPMFIPNFYFFFGCLISLALEHGARKAWKESKKSLPMQSFAYVSCISESVCVHVGIKKVHAYKKKK